jgi:hypothetical protein
MAAPAAVGVVVAVVDVEVVAAVGVAGSLGECGSLKVCCYDYKSGGKMLPIERRNKTIPLVVLIMVCSILLAGQVPAVVAQKIFASPEEAVSSFIDALTKNDLKELLSILGPEGESLLSSGDPVADTQGKNDFLRKIGEEHAIEKDGPTKAVLLVGTDHWPFPIPVIKEGEGWYFDTSEGKEEILNRRIGRNELFTIQTCLAIVDAQREYAMMDSDGDGLHEYAEKFKSDPGKRNGLYWPTAEGEEPSPLGELLAKARAEGYKTLGSHDTPQPYYGYYFRMLMQQGNNAPGGAYAYVIRGKMIGGFAVVAYPAQYSNTGIMTFIVNHDGVVYQQDLGTDTEKIAKDMKLFDPDTAWEKVE